MNESELLTLVLRFCAQATGRNKALGDDQADKGFIQLGVDSVSMFRIQLDLEEHLGLSLPDTLLIDHPTPRQTARELARRMAVRQP